MDIKSEIYTLQMETLQKETAIANKRVEQIMEGHGLHRDHHILLLTIMNDERMSKTTVPSTMMNVDVAKRNTKELFDKGFIIEKEGSNGQEYILSKKGKDLFAEIDSSIRSIKMDLYSNLNDDELASFKKILQNINAYFDKL